MACSNNAIALCNKILRNAPGRANVYFTLGRISARKGLRGDATRNFLEYASRMQQDGRIEEGIRALAEVLDLMPELNDVRTMVEDLATRSGIALPRRKTPLRTDRVPTPVDSPAFRDQKSQNLVFLDVDYAEDSRRTPAASTRVPTRPPMEVVPTTAIITPLSAALITAPNGEDIEVHVREIPESEIGAIYKAEDGKTRMRLMRRMNLMMTQRMKTLVLMTQVACLMIAPKLINSEAY
jgi:hypothetical protein